MVFSGERTTPKIPQKSPSCALQEKLRGCHYAGIPYHDKKVVMVRLRFSAMIPSRHNRADFISESHLLSLSLAEARKIKRLINLRLWHLRTISKGLYPVRITVATTFLQESIINDFVLYSLLRKIWPVEIHGLVFRLLTWFSHLESCRTLCPVWLNHHRISTGSASAWDSICAVVQIFFFQSSFSSSVNRFFLRLKILVLFPNRAWISKYYAEIFPYNW